MESIQKLLERHYAEASWRQPAVLLLDDLDQIAAAPSGPEQEISGEALYFTKVAQGAHKTSKLRPEQAQWQDH